MCSGRPGLVRSRRKRSVKGSRCPGFDSGPGLGCFGKWSSVPFCGHGGHNLVVR
jgi:hypothetical protein